jgi:hypothetical protein
LVTTIARVRRIPLLALFFVSASGAVEITASRPPKSEGVSGHGVVITLTFEAKTTGRFPVKITKAALVHPNQQLTSALGPEVIVSVQ